MKVQSGLQITYNAVVSALLLLYVLVQSNQAQNTWWHGSLLEFCYMTEPNGEQKHPTLLG